MNESQFKIRVQTEFGLTYHTIKQKLAYDMVMWNDGSEGTVAGAFAGHSHGCSIPHFEYHGWVYAYREGQWELLRDGISGWRQGDNPFPKYPDSNLNSAW